MKSSPTPWGESRMGPWTPWACHQTRRRLEELVSLLFPSSLVVPSSQIFYLSWLHPAVTQSHIQIFYIKWNHNPEIIANGYKLGFSFISCTTKTIRSPMAFSSRKLLSWDFWNFITQSQNWVHLLNGIWYSNKVKVNLMLEVIRSMTLIKNFHHILSCILLVVARCWSRIIRLQV